MVYPFLKIWCLSNFISANVFKLPKILVVQNNKHCNKNYTVLIKFNVLKPHS